MKPERKAVRQRRLAERAVKAGNALNLLAELRAELSQAETDAATQLFRLAEQIEQEAKLTR